MSWEKSALVCSEMLTLLVNILTTDEKYCRRNMLNLTQQVEAPLSQKQKTFSGFFIEFLESVLNLEHLENKDEYSVIVISNIIDSERSGFLNV